MDTFSLDIEMLPAYFDAQTLLFRITSRLAAQRGGQAAAERLMAIQSRHEEIVAARDASDVIVNNRLFHLACQKIANLLILSP